MTLVILFNMYQEHLPVVLQALSDGQHSPAFTGAGVPSGQVKKTMVQNVLAQADCNAVQKMK
jgi:hypothetical protein